jgi:hypothetical protein
MRISNSIQYLLLILITSFGSLNAVAQDAKLIVFSAANENDRLTAFNDTQGPKLDSMAKVYDLTYELVTDPLLIPKDILILPSIYYVSSSKKSFYSGRYDALDRIESFINNEQAFDLPKTSMLRENIYLYLDNQFEIGTKLKVTQTEGTVTQKEDFKPQFIKAFNKSINKLDYFSSYPFKEQSKQFYLNVYPFLSPDGTYYLSIEVFSQHHCKEAIYNNFDKPIIGRDVYQIGKKVAEFYEQKLPELVLNPSIEGETITLLTASTQGTRKNWNYYGLSESTTSADHYRSSQINEGNYLAISTPKLSPSVNFTFPPPVSNYNGQISDLQGQLNIENNIIKGNFTLNLRTLNMGDDMLNQSVFTEMLFTDSLPNATFRFNQMLDEIPTNQQVPINGELTLLGLDEPVAVIANFQPLSNANRLLVSASFTLDIRSFPTLEQPDAPTPQNHTLVVKARFVAERQ